MITGSIAASAAAWKTLVGIRSTTHWPSVNVPGWLAMNAEAFKANVVRLPTREEMTQDVNEQLIVEFYSRF